MTDQPLTLINIPDDCDSLEEAIEQLADHGTIILAPGRYEVNETLEIDRPMTIKSSTGKAKDVIIYGNEVGTFRLLAETVRFEGLSIHNEGGEENILILSGKPEFFDCDFHSDEKSGMAVEGKNSFPHVVRCVCHDNGDGGTYIDSGGGGLFEDCSYYGNGLSNFDLEEKADPMIRRCKMYDGMLSGICIHNEGLGTFEDCEIYGNAYPGVAINENGNTLFRRCKIYSHETCGIHVIESGKLTMEDCDVYENICGMEVADDSTVSALRCNFYENTYIGAVVLQKGKATFTDCSFFDNENCNILFDNALESQLVQCKILRGKKTGFLLDNGSSASVKECTFMNNKEAALVVHDSNLILNDCSFQHENVRLLYLGENKIESNNSSLVEVKEDSRELSEDAFKKFLPPEEQAEGEPEESSEEESDSMSHYINILFLNDDQYDIEAFQERIKKNWNLQLESFEDVEEEEDDVVEDNENGIKNHHYNFIVDNNLFYIQLEPVTEEILSDCVLNDSNPLWPESSEVLSKSKYILFVSMIYKTENARESFINATKIIDSLVDAPNVLGVNNDISLFPQKGYREFAAELKEDHLPILLWVNIYVTKKENEEEGYSALSHGMYYFGKLEFEVVNSGMTPRELYEFMYNLIYYTINSDVVFHDGDTIGSSAVEKNTIMISPGVNIEENTIKILLD